MNDEEGQSVAVGLGQVADGLIHQGNAVVFIVHLCGGKKKRSSFFKSQEMCTVVVREVILMWDTHTSGSLRD